MSSQALTAAPAQAGTLATPKGALRIPPSPDPALGERVKRLMKRTAHAEFPHSKTSRIFGNVRIHARTNDEMEVSCVFQTLRTKDGTTDLYFGKSNYRLTTGGDGLRIREKRCPLGSEGLRPHGRISIVL